MSDLIPIVKMDDVELRQGDNIILKDVNFEINAGEFIYLIGKTGSGKSTLLKALYADIDLHKGSASVCGFNLGTVKRKKIPFLRRKIGIVFQDFELLTDRSVDANLEFVLKATGWKDKSLMKERMAACLSGVGLQNKGYKMPHELSGGEQQRVAIARALLNKPELILADEPTGNLDPTTTAEILNLLFEISSEGTSVIMATHDYASMEKFDARKLFCQDGKVIDSAEVQPISDYSL